MSALYPNVPTAIGVPAVLRSVLSPADDDTETALADSSDQTRSEIARSWGLYTQDGEQATTADNIVAFEFGAEARISDYPVEAGGFGSFNKVQTPYDIRLMMSRGGSVEDRQDFLGALQDAWQSTTLYNVVTPECVYLDVNVVGLRTQREADRGAGLLTMEVALRKVRQTATLAFTKTKDAAGSGAINDGSVQTTAAPAVEAAK